ncbi:uncharacterized protein LAESUDRAFT_813683 [Laetiporus sulphureus 93-53]|uniref:Uncharacterized protein n=1 Tax=Laetiporus sulphureus 93-53 TaxID=1314785 RepID=A0A165DJV5_9APHY|nr:uncharacterized protein LAESUDRAFT_813683 [Laetiporus sulphureus 93-53]KZT05043.1 hypothetical protein LAESUDRAFT_813683 [Laetiporus sulphureus 93-53]
MTLELYHECRDRVSTRRNMLYIASGGAHQDISKASLSLVMGKQCWFHMLHQGIALCLVNADPRPSLTANSPLSRSAGVMSQGLTGQNAAVPILSVSIQGISYGFASCLFVATAWTFLSRRSTKVDRVMLGLAIVLWILPTIQVTIGVFDTIIAFVDHAQGPSGPEDYLSAQQGPTFLVDVGMYALSTLIGDAVVIYRCYTVWQTWTVIVLPCLAYLGSLGSIFYNAYSFTHQIVSGERIIFVYSFTLAANATATAALAYRIWVVDRRSGRLQTLSSFRTLRPIRIVVIESGALYTSLLIVLLVSAIRALGVVYILTAIMSPMVSIIFNIIFIRVRLLRDSAVARWNNPDTHQLSALDFAHSSSQGAPDSLETDRTRITKPRGFSHSDVNFGVQPSNDNSRPST